jgi:hypothetical protein
MCKTLSLLQDSLQMLVVQALADQSSVKEMMSEVKAETLIITLILNSMMIQKEM